MIKFCQTCKDNNYIESGGANGYYWCWLDSVKVCKTCGTEFKDIDFPATDLKVIIQISEDVSFIEAMIKLHDTDIIEYELKMSQLCNQVQQQESIKIQNDTTPKCPHCKSTNIKPISALNRGVSVAMWGIFSKKINKSFECEQCGYTW